VLFYCHCVQFTCAEVTIMLLIFRVFFVCGIGLLFSFWDCQWKSLECCCVGRAIIDSVWHKVISVISLFTNLWLAVDYKFKSFSLSGFYKDSFWIFLLYVMALFVDTVLLILRKVNIEAFVQHSSPVPILIAHVLAYLIVEWLLYTLNYAFFIESIF